MTYDLRPYQNDMVEAMLTALKGDKPTIIQAATGAGKSIVIAAAAHRLGSGILVLCPSLELLLQNYEKMKAYRINATLYSAAANSKDLSGDVVLATIGSIYRKPQLFKRFKHIIIDEADVVSPNSMDGMYRSFFNAIGCRSILGLTATPYRMHTEYERENFKLYAMNKLKIITAIGRPSFWSGGIAYKIETQELIDKGYLSPIKYKRDSEDLHKLVLNKNGTEYSEASVEAWTGSKVEKIADYTVWADQYCKRNLIFCTSVKQSARLQSILEGRGIHCGLVTAETPANEREMLVGAFRAGKLRHMINCSVFLAGFDVPELDCIIFAKPTLSPRVFYQAVGRGLRLDPANPNKKLRVLDLAGATTKIGPVETMTLQGSKLSYALFSSVGRLDERKGYRFEIKKKKEGRR